MVKKLIIFGIIATISATISAQSPSFQTYVNPVIPGDHPDPTLTKIGDYFYTSGSSFNPTPKIYRSTDLVHWQVIAQPVKPSWSVYGNQAGGGIWGGHLVFYNNIYWHYFGRGGGNMYFVTATNPEGPWSDPVQVRAPSSISYLGVDNSIFIDEDTGKWYMLTKHGRSENEIIELGNDGQPNGEIIDLGWLNPDEDDNPFGWAEGPVLWKYNGTYYYSVAQHLAGNQYVMKSDTLSDNRDDWSVKPEPMQFGSRGNFQTPNHISPAILLDDSTSWVIGHSYHKNWLTQGRQGLLLQITYDDDGFPQFEYPQNAATTAPNLPNSGVSWAVPKSDMFNQTELDPDWSFLGYASGRSHSLSNKPGWLQLSASDRGDHRLIKNDGEHQYALITRMDFRPANSVDKAGLFIINGPENLEARAFSGMDSDGERIFGFSFNGREYDEPNEIGAVVWLKLERNEHELSAFFSADGDEWTQIGREIDADELNVEQTDFNSFTGNQQGLFTQSKEAFFDLYIYRDAYSTIAANSPANFAGVEQKATYLSGINHHDWAMYAGVEFGSESPPQHGFDYQRTPRQISVQAASSSGGSAVEVWIDALDTGTKIAEIAITNTGSVTTYEDFTSEVDSVNGTHDVYLRFVGTTGEDLFCLKSFQFSPRRVPLTANEGTPNSDSPKKFILQQNYPNPFNPTTVINYQLPAPTLVRLRVFDAVGREVAELVNHMQATGNHQVTFNAEGLASGVYLYRLEADGFLSTQKMLLLK